MKFKLQSICIGKMPVFLLVAVLLLGINTTYAQCPATLTGSVAVTPATCPSSGTATITTNAGSNPQIYTLLTGPSGVGLNTPQSSNVFSALLAGNYTVQAQCAGNGASVTLSFTIASSYVPLSMSTSVATNCGNGTYTRSDTVNITASNGTLPYQYSLIQSSNPNYADGLSNYSSNSNQPVTAYGTYQARVKDACNAFTTTTVFVMPSLNPVNVSFAAQSPVVCNPTTYQYALSMTDAVTGLPINTAAYAAAGGININIYAQAVGSCTPTGPVLLNYNSDTSANKIAVSLPVSLPAFYAQVISPCGDTTTTCVTAPTASSFPIFFVLGASAQGCGVAGNPFTEKLFVSRYGNLIQPDTLNIYRGTNSSGTLVGTIINPLGDASIALLSGIDTGSYYYSMIDACGVSANGVVSNPAAAAAGSLAITTATNSCYAGGPLTTLSGTSTVVIQVQGFLPGGDNVSSYVIVSGPTNVGVAAYSNSSGQAVQWNNMVPGNYTIAVTTGCGIDTFPLTYVVPGYLTPLKEDITATATLTCGTGTGSIIATTDYNGGLTPSYVLVNGATNTGVDSNSTGIFLSVPPGNYYVELKLVNQTTCSTTPGYYINSNTVTITNPAAGPQITQRIGVICEDGSGNSLTTGAVYLTLSGAPPLKLEYKTAGSPTYIDYTDNAPNDTSITGLQADTVYNLRLTSCGVSTTSSVSVSKLSPLATTTQLQPCAGQPYELDAPQLTGATFKWTNSIGTVVSTSYNYTIPDYTADYDGVYTCTVSFGSCVIRIINVTLNSTLCGEPLSRLIIGGNVFDDGTGIVNGSGIGSASGAQLYMNLINPAGTVIASTAVNSTGTYSLANINPGGYTLQLTTNPGTVDQPQPATQLPSNWVNTGENFGAGAGGTGIVNGLLSVTLTTTNITNADFGIDQLPSANNASVNYPNNVPGTQYAVPALSGSDPEDGTLGTGNTFVIVTIPPAGDTLYYNGTPVVAGQTITNYNPSLLLINPADITTVSTFTYVTVDAAGKQGSTPATITINWINVLPVTLLNFTASKAGSTSLLQWSTAQEIGIKSFEIDAAPDAINFYPIGTVAAQGTGITPANYTFTDTKPVQGINYYRLKIINADGTFSYSGIRSVNFSSTAAQGFTLIPNPADNNAVVSLNELSGTNANLSIINAQGQVVLQQIINAGSLQSNIDITNLQTGIYMAVIVNNGNTYQQKLEVQKAQK